jgi:hypothetical protein
MIITIIKFIENQNNNLHEPHYIGIDLEFTQVTKESKDIAIMQLNLENNTSGYIFIFKPSELPNYNVIIKLFTNVHIIKILHGSESLDIPYLFNQLLITKENIDNFCNNFYDTKFLCNYYNILNNIKESCGIYSLLYNHNIITLEQLNYMNKIEQDMGHIQNIVIDIHNMDANILKYALYDVLYLPQLIKKLLSYAVGKNGLYYNALTDILHIVFKYKRKIDPIFLELEKLINQQNNNYIYENNVKFSFQSIYEIYLYQYFTFNDLIEINYFKNFFTIIVKLLIYSSISKTNKYDKYYRWLSSYKYLNNIIIITNKLFKHLLVYNTNDIKSNTKSNSNA